MPRVSEQHLAARRQQIVDAATRCFIRHGFHQTSMQDVIKEAELSVGAFYRYFTGKNALIRAIAVEKVGLVTSRIDHLLSEEPLPALEAVLGEVLRQVDLHLGPDGPARIAVQVWGEATHDKELAGVIAEVYGTIRERGVRIARAAVAAGQLPRDADPFVVGSALFGLIQGYILQRILLGDIDHERYLAGVAALLRAAPTASAASTAATGAGDAGEHEAQ